MAFAWGGLVEAAAAQHERPYEFNDTHVAISIERFMGIDFVDYEGPDNTHASARLFLNASEPVPTSYARFGLDVFIKRFSVGVAAGATSDDVGVLAPRVGYLFGLTPTIGLWMRVGGFYATTPGPNYLGLYAEALLAWFPYSFFALHMGPTLDIAFTDTPNRDYVAIGIPEFGMTALF
jgi:hypothetical protein